MANENYYDESLDVNLGRLATYDALIKDKLAQSIAAAAFLEDTDINVDIPGVPNSASEIDDTTVDERTTWSSQKISEMLGGATNSGGSGTAGTLDAVYARIDGGNEMTGPLTMQGDVSGEAATGRATGNTAGALDMSNSNIIGVNGLYFNDVPNNGMEGINFPSSDKTKFDSIYSKDGILHYTPSRLVNTDGAGADYEVYHEGNKPDLVDLGAAEGSSVSGTVPEAVGWYRIAETDESIYRATGLFVIDGGAPNCHSLTYLIADCIHGVPNSTHITQINHTSWAAAAAFTKARIVYIDTSAGLNSKAYLEIYCPSNLTITTQVKLSNHSSWSLIDPSTPGEVPDGYNTSELGFVHRAVKSVVVNATSQVTTPELRTSRYSNGNGMIYKNHTANEDHGTNIKDTTADGTELTLNIKASASDDESVVIVKNGTNYPVYSTLNKPTPMDINAAEVNHTHSNYAASNHTHTEYAASSHTHNDYAVKNNTVITNSISLGRAGNSTVGTNSTALGYNVTASGNRSHAEGDNTTASGTGAHAEGYLAIATNSYAHAEGGSTSASGQYSHAQGHTTTASAAYSHAEGAYVTASNMASHAQGKYSKSMTNGGSLTNTVGDAMVIGNGTAPTARSNAFRVTFAGATYGLAAFNSSGADYAEFFEWEDGNTDSEDRVGYFVTLNDDKIVYANDGDYILGITSGHPCMVGNGDEDWSGRWERDDFGRIIKDEVSTVDDEGNESTGWKYRTAADYDPDQTYVERKDRPEWDYVGMLGVLAVRDDGSCQVNGFAKVSSNGVATAAASYVAGGTYRVTKRVSANVVQVVFK